MNILRKYNVFLKAKLFCLVYGYIELVVFLLYIIGSVVFNDVYFFIFAAILSYIFLTKFIIVKKSGCLKLLHTSKTKYQLTMCGGLLNQSDTKIMRLFYKSFISVFDKKTLSKIPKETIYINTHSVFIRGIIKMLSGKNFNQKELENEIKNGCISINGYDVKINYLKNKKNLLVAAVYPIIPSVDQLEKFEKKYKEVPFYEMYLPVQVIAECLNNNSSSPLFKRKRK